MGENLGTHENYTDMGKYGGLSDLENGVGDPSILVDRQTGTIWVSALRTHGKPGKRAWNSSESGLSHHETGQFRDENGIPHSTIIYSKNRGETWRSRTGAKPETTEAQVIELNDGSLMMNMRDSRNVEDKNGSNGRAIMITSALGETWLVHPTSNSALIEPTCMASILMRSLLSMENCKKWSFSAIPLRKQNAKK